MCWSAAAAAELAAAGLPCGGPRNLARILELAGGELRPAFRLVHLEPEVTPGLTAFICQHLSRALVWNEAWCTHPNGARGLRELTAVVDDPGAIAPAYAKLFGAERMELAEGCLRVESGTALLRFTTRGGLEGLHPAAAGLPAYPTPWLAALSVGVADPERTAACLAAAGVAVRRWRGRLLVPPAEATGVILEFAAD